MYVRCASVPGTDPDRASYQAAIDAAQDLVITARHERDTPPEIRDKPRRTLTPRHCG
jgi:hypothetical protein